MRINIFTLYARIDVIFALPSKKNALRAGKMKLKEVYELSVFLMCELGAKTGSKQRTQSSLYTVKFRNISHEFLSACFG